MATTATIAIKAVVRGLANSGALNVGQMHAIYHALEDAASELDKQGDSDGAAELREIIDASFGDAADLRS